MATWYLRVLCLFLLTIKGNLIWWLNLFWLSTRYPVMNELSLSQMATYIWASKFQAIFQNCHRFQIPLFWLFENNMEKGGLFTTLFPPEHSFFLLPWTSQSIAIIRLRNKAYKKKNPFKHFIGWNVFTLGNSKRQRIVFFFT